MTEESNIKEIRHSNRCTHGIGGGDEYKDQHLYLGRGLAQYLKVGTHYKCMTHPNGMLRILETHLGIAKPKVSSRNCNKATGITFARKYVPYELADAKVGAALNFTDMHILSYQPLDVLIDIEDLKMDDDTHPDPDVNTMSEPTSNDGIDFETVEFTRDDFMKLAKRVPIYDLVAATNAGGVREGCKFGLNKPRNEISIVPATS